ncbi:MAG: GGDEF domain-containing protein [Oscillospiraceae bacterium]|nr:GGDEF domain-containing protein [Candidatus Limimonas egerieequi]
MANTRKTNDYAANSKRLRILLIIGSSICLAALTVITGFLAKYNTDHAVVTLHKIINYVILGVGYLVVSAMGINIGITIFTRHATQYNDTDKLTSGINYEKFLKDAEELLSYKDELHAVFYGDILNFKYINDTFGYDVGDKLLMYISQRIREAVTNVAGLYARVSADNYAVIVPYKDKNDFVETIYTIIDDIGWFEDIQKANYKPEIYVGIYCSGDDPTSDNLSISEMIDRANMAQKSVKGSSEYHIAFYTEEIRERVIAEKELERKMESALANGEFKAYFQPKYEVSTGEIVGAEALVRWDSPESGFMSPGKFIPLFEQNGFIINLDQYVFETVCKNIRDWIDAGVKVVPISVNVSRLQFYRLDFVKRYTKIKEKYDIPDGILELEFTESIVFENLDILRKIVLSLKKSGFNCSIDDFGSGYSSLNILKNLPMDTLKLDKLFFDDSENMSRDKALISSVINMSRALEMKTVAEGIENWAQVAFLKEIGCDIIQGYVYSEPIPHARFTNLLEGNRRKEMPVELRRARKSLDEVGEDDARLKYAALLDMLEGSLIEVDYNTGEYTFVNSSEERRGTNYDEDFSAIIEKHVHPDDIKTVKNRCASVSVMSTFYQNESKIITELRVKSKTDGYKWAKMTIDRLDDNPEHNDFRALIYVEFARQEDADRDKVAKEPEMSLQQLLKNACSFIYEFDLDARTFRQLSCNDTFEDELPKSGELAWLRECFLPKVAIKEDRENLVKFANLDVVHGELFDKPNGQMKSDIAVKLNGFVVNASLVLSRMYADEEHVDIHKCLLFGIVE